MKTDYHLDNIQFVTYIIESETMIYFFLSEYEHSIINASNYLISSSEYYLLLMGIYLHGPFIIFL